MKRLRKRAFLQWRYTISLDGGWELDSNNPARGGQTDRCPRYPQAEIHVVSDEGLPGPCVVARL
ncbi:hypothetical protein D3C72_820420 [compost metagenome]